jgi:ryanodine receptor 2
MAIHQPRPVASSAIGLSEQLLALSAQLAEYAHEHWARRIAEGWSWGPERDDAAGRHPCLVPYGRLPDSETEYKCDSALETLRTMLALGDRVERSRSA